MTRQERAARTRRLILEAGAEEFSERGYVAATCVGIAARAGVTRGAFYFHFPSKRHLASAVLDEWIARPAAAGPLPFKLEELKERALATARQLESDPIVSGSFRLCLEQGLDTTQRQRPYLVWTGRYRQLLEEAGRQGALRSDVATGDAAELLVGAFAGAHIASQLLPDEADLGQRVVSFMRHLLPSMATPEALDRIALATSAGTADETRTTTGQGGVKDGEPPREPSHPSRPPAGRTSPPIADSDCRYVT
ncbi:ScbR family autoregulator-binding transcription factor [Streptomyces sp. NPDC058629]|uniref:ScbR family autoregulator-binding transcription factor n=1 Tax=Streptomyces sp. NPDC058629 TaxID=3346565 RepID=UPI0036584831